MELYAPIWHRDSDQLLRMAIEKWGSGPQTQMAFGECGEFVTLAGKMAQGRATAEDVIDEIADVTIMMRQMALLYGLSGVERRIAFKLDRLQKKLGI